MVIEDKYKDQKKYEFNKDKVSISFKICDVDTILYYAKVGDKYYEYIKAENLCYKQEITKEKYEFDLDKINCVKNLYGKMNEFKFDGNTQKYVADEVRKNNIGLNY